MSEEGSWFTMAGKKYEDYVQKGKPWWKIILAIFISNVGMAFLCITFAGFGDYSTSESFIQNNSLILKKYVFCFKRTSLICHHWCTIRQQSNAVERSNSTTVKFDTNFDSIRPPLNCYFAVFLTYPCRL